MIVRRIVVEAPVARVYEQWLRFEDFPRFLAGVEEVRRLDERRTRWRARLAGRTVEWEAELTEVLPGKRVVWEALGGYPHGVVVLLEPVGEGRTRVELRDDFRPRRLVERVAVALGLGHLRIGKDLRAFKRLVEAG